MGCERIRRAGEAAVVTGGGMNVRQASVPEAPSHPGRPQISGDQPPRFNPNKTTLEFNRRRSGGLKVTGNLF